MSSLCKWLIVSGFAVALSSMTFAEDKAALAKRLHNAADASSLDDPALKPWHLKLSVQLYDAKGNPSEQGTIEEWWTPDADKRVFTTPSYSATEVSTTKGIYRTKGQPAIPYLLFAALRSVVHPTVPTKITDKLELAMQPETFGKVKLDCFVSYRAGIRNTGTVVKPPAPGSVATTCLDQGVDRLRVSWLEPEVTMRTRIGVFQDRQVGIDTRISLYGIPAISQHIEELDGKSFDSSIFVPTADMEDRSNDPAWISGTATTHSIVHRPAPIYPEDAKRDHISGAVMLIVTIGPDGHVTDIQTVGNPNAILAKSAMTALKQFIYMPYLVNGVATPIRTTFSIHYNFDSPG